MLDITVEQLESAVVCRPAGEIDAFSVARLRERLGEIAGSAHLVLDLDAVPFLDSAAMGALIATIRRLREGGGDVAVISTRTHVRRLLHTAGFDRLVPISESLDEALGRLGPPNESR